MAKLWTRTTELIQAIDHAARANGFIPYLHGDIARAIQFDRDQADGRLIEVVLSYDQTRNITGFYQHLSKKIVVNREIENSDKLYSFVSAPYVVECAIREHFDPFENDIALFNVDSLFIETGRTPKATSEISETSDLVCCIPEDEWDITNVIGFADKLGTYPDHVVIQDQQAVLNEIQLLKMRQPFGVNIADQLIGLLLTQYPGNAFLFLISFSDGKDWLAKQFIELASQYSIALNEDFDLREIISPKKAELLNVYSEYFNFKKDESESQKQHSILTYLKLLFDSPTLTIETPYIDRVSVLSAPETFTTLSNDATVSTFADRWACCQEGNICTEVDKITCTALDGIWNEGVLCADVDCQPDIPGDCEYPPCPKCDPTACGDDGGEPCCCCSSVDIVAATVLQCHKQVIISCNRDGTGPGPDADGVEQVFDSSCGQCLEVCEMVINSSGPDGCINPPNPTLPKICCGELPTPWFLDPPTPCVCDCARYDGDGVCSLHCMSCSGEHAYCQSIVTPGGQDNDCAYDFTIEPGPECCGAPAAFDVIFVIDDTGSMGSEIIDVRNGIIGFVQNGIDRGIISRLSLVTFKDDVWVYSWLDTGVFSSSSQVGRGGDEKPRPGPIDFTTNAANFEDLVGSLTASGGGDGPENIYDACMQGLHYNMPGAFGNIMITVCDNSARSDTPREELINFANVLNYKIFFVGPATGAEQIAIQTGGLHYDLTGADWDQIFLDASSAAGIFPSSCTCLDFTPLPIIRAVGDPSDGDNYFPECDCPDIRQCLPNTPGELPPHCYEFPIPKCVSPDTAEDCAGICDVPFGINVCGTIITVTPTETNMTCCGSLGGFGCACDSGGGTCPDFQCCGVDCDELCDWLAIPFPAPIHSSVDEAQNFVWNNCLTKATGTCGDDCLLFPTGDCEDDGETPIEYFKEKSALFDEVAGEYANCGGVGGACCIGINCTIVSSESECSGIWQGFGSVCTPNPCGGPGAVEFECVTSECDFDDQCIVGEPDTGVNRVQDQCDEINKGCTSVSSPSIAILNNGVGLIAYESMIDNISTIKIQQFHTSVDFKLLANRTFGYGRLQNSIRWEVAPGLTQVSVATMWSYDELAVDIIHGTDTPADTDAWKDVIVFASGPLAGACFPIYNVDPAGIDEDTGAWYVKFMVQGDATFTSPFFSSDDYYQARWYIYDYQTALRNASGGINTEYKNLIGGAGASAQDYPFPDYLFGSSRDVDNILLGDQITDHIYNGKRVPIAHPKIDVSKNYARPYENAQYAYLTYQALEDGKWNVYLKQIRLSEYSREKLIDAAVGNDKLTPIANPTDAFDPGLGLAGVIYRITCVSDNCSDIGGNDFLMQRTVVMEVLLPDGREVLNPDPDDPGGYHDDNGGPLCPGVKAENFPQSKVFVKFVQSAVGDRCPDQFQFDEIFQNWATGQEYFVPLTAVSGQQIFAYLQREGDVGISVGQFDPPINQGDTVISSSSVGANWFNDFDSDTNNWSVIESEPFDILSQYKGLDISEPILISDTETGHCTNPTIQVDYDNHIFIAYEHTDSGIQNVRLVGTKQAEDELPAGVGTAFNPDDSLNYFFDKDDFVYSVDVTTSGDGSNQLPNLYIDLNNVLHLAWQSNRDKVWEIYYANSTNNFVYKRITKHEGRSLRPSITSNPSGNMFITWHDNRYGNYEIMMAYHPGIRVIPLYQQDPYLASLRNFHDGWSHTTDVLPLNVENNSDGPICYSHFDVNFYEDRNLEHLAFTVSSNDFPFAFTLPGSESDVTTVDLSDIDTQWVTTHNYDYSGPTIVTQNFVSVSNEVDTFLDNSSIKTILIPELNVTGGCSFGTIELRASNLANDPEADTQWTAEYSLSGSEGELIDPEVLGVTETVVGRYKQIRLKWTCDVSTDTFSVADGVSDAHVESDLTWTNDLAEIRLGYDPTSSSATWGEISTSVNTNSEKTSDLIDIGGTMYIAWAPTSGGIKFAEFDPASSSFINEEWAVASIPNNVMIEISIENIFGIPAIAYVGFGTTSNTYSVVYATKFGGTWNSYTIVTGLPTFVWSQVSLFDDNSQPGVIVHFVGGGTSAINFYASTSQGQSWQPAESVAINVDTTGEISAAMIAGIPAVTYLDTLTGNRVYNTRPGAWGVPVTMTVTSPITSTRCSLMHYDTHPLFFFSDSSGVGLRWSRYDGVTWSGDEIIDGAAEVGYYHPMLVNSIPTIAYYEASGSAEFDLKYAELTSLPLNTWDINIVASNIVANTSSTNHWIPSASWSGDPPGGETISEHAAIMPLVDTNNIVYIEEFDVTGIERFDAYFRFDNFDVPINTTIISSHMEMKSRVASGAAKSVIRLLDEVDTRVFEDNTQVQIPIAAAGDDAELELPDLWNIGDNTIRFGSVGGSDYCAYLRFLLNIPVNSRVIESYLEFVPTASNSGDAHATIVLVDGSTVFADTYSYSIAVENQGSDADYRLSDERWGNSSETVRFGESSGETYEAYLRFYITGIPTYALISSASITMQADATIASDSDVTIKLLDYGDVDTFPDTTVLQFQVAASADDADFNTDIEEWRNNLSDIRFGVTDGEDYNAYMRFNLNVDPDLKYIAARLRLTPASDSSGTSTTSIKLLNRNDDWPSADHTAFSTMLTADIYATSSDDDAMAEVIDSLPKRWDNDENHIWWGTEHASDGDHVWDGYVRFNTLTAGIVDEGFDNPRINRAHIAMQSEGATDASTTVIHGINRNVERSGGDGFTHWTTIIAEIPSSASDAFLADDADWTVNEGTLQFGNDGSTYDAILRFVPEDMDSSVRLDRYDYISEAYLTLIAVNNTSGGASAKIQRINDCTVDEFVESDSGTIVYRATTVNWSPDSWIDSDAVISPDIRLIVQDYVDQCDPEGSTAAIGLGIQHVSGSILKTFAAYEGAGYGEPAQLFVEYSPYIDVTPYSPDKQVSWTTGAWSGTEVVETPNLWDIVKPWFDSYFSYYSTRYIGFRISTATDVLKQVKSFDSGEDVKLHIEYSSEGARITFGGVISWVDSSNWDTGGSGDAVEVTSPDILSLIETVFTTSNPFRYDWDQWGYGLSDGIGYYLDEEHTVVNPSFTGHYIGFVIEEVSSGILREFISRDSYLPSAAAILELDRTEDGPRNRYMVDSATEHPGVSWTATGWNDTEETADIADLVTEYLNLPGYSTSGSYMGLVIENQLAGNPLKSFWAYDGPYGGAQLNIEWTTGGSLLPTGSSVDWLNVQDWAASVSQDSVDISTIVEEFLGSSAYSGSGYIGLAIEDNGSSNVREFDSYDSGSTPASLVIHYSGPRRSTLGGVDWDDTSTPTLGSWVLDEEVSTPDLATLVQSYINMAGYDASAGYAIGFTIEDNASINLKRMISYETAAGVDAADLFVSWRNNFDFTVELNSLATARLCLSAGESSTGSLDLTPQIRVDSQGSRTVESPLPIDHYPNWTYFTAIEATTDDNEKVIMDQKTSISCESCSEHAVTTTWDFETCSLTVEVSNTDVLPKNVNIAVLLYADEERNSLASQLSTFAWGDIDRFTMEDLQPASSFQEDGEFVIAPGGVLRMLAWPTINPSSELICGVKYFYEITINSDGGSIPDTSVSTGEWICSCESERWAGRFEEQQQNLTTMARWRSSSEGLADIRLTETKSDNFNACVQIRPDFAGLVMYESNRDGKWNLYVSSFAYQPSHKMYASAAESIISPWSEPVHKSDIVVKNSDGEHIEGSGSQFMFDQYGNLFMVASMPYSSALMDGSQELCHRFTPDTMQYILVHRCGLDDFDFEEIQPDEVERVCEQEDITKEIYTISSPTFNKLIRMIRVQKEFVKYHVSRVKNSLPVVDQCRIGFEIIGTPESVAIRIRNDRNGDWSDWLPFDPDIGSEVIKLDHDLTRGSGVKIVQFQVATPAGLAPTATMEIVADFKPIVHQVNFYKPLGDCETGTPCPPEPIEPSHLEEADIWVEDNKLNMMENVPIASVRVPEVETDDDDVKDFVIRASDYIFVEIIPEESYFKQFAEEELTGRNITPTFDFIHQGGQDEFNLPTVFDSESRSFRGWITINKEDQGAFRDGLAYIVVHFKNDCSDPTSVSAGSVTEKSAYYTKDEFNVLVPGTPSFNTGQTDVWSGDRSMVGEIERKIVIRPSEDPYFVFGNPNYRLQENE